MGFRFHKRIKPGGGFGLNVSKSGINPSLRTKLGTFNKSGYSVKTGISGLGYKNSGCMALLTFIVIITFLIYSIKNQ